MVRLWVAAAVAGASWLLLAPLPPLIVAGEPGSWPGSAGTSLRALSTVGLLLLPVLVHRLPARIRLVGSILIPCLLGVLLAQAEIVRLQDSRWPTALAGAQRIVTGTVVGLTRTLGSDGPRPVQALQLELDSLACVPDDPRCTSTASRPRPRTLRLIDARVDRDYQPGQRWRMTLALQPPDGLLNRGGFDRERWLLLERIDATASVRDAQRLDEAAPPGVAASAVAASAALSRLRLGLSASLHALPAATPDRDAELALIEALALGRSDLISDAWRELLQATGTSHLMAISGLHVGLVFGLLMLCLRRLPVPAALGVDGAAWCLAAGYAAVAGFGLPVQRALLMLLVLVVVNRRARIAAPGATLAFAVLAVLLMDPLAPLSGGFWLSAGAVAMLVWTGVTQRGAQDRDEPSAAKGSGALANWRPVVRAQAWLGLILLPVSAYLFQEMSFVGPLVNLLAIPFVGTVTVPLALSAVLLASVDVLSPLANLLLYGALASIELLRVALEAAASVPAAASAASLPDARVLHLLLLMTLLAALPLGQWRPSGGAGAHRWLLPVLALPVIVWAGGGHPVRRAELHLLDVGHGLAAILLTRDSVLVIDTGGGQPGSTRAERVLLPYLRALGRPRIDHLVLTHLDNDHAAGAPFLVGRYPHMEVVVPDARAARRVIRSGSSNVRACRAGAGFTLEGVHVDFLAPAAHDRGSDNDLSCVVLIDTGEQRWMVAGDIEAIGERRLVERVARLPLDVLIAPHHGSKTSSGPEFVRAFPSRHVVFPAARRSRWGFPHESVRMRYIETGSRLYVTGETGALVFRSFSANPGGSPLSWRQVARRRWRQS